MQDNTKFLKVRTRKAESGKLTFWGLFESSFNTSKGINPFWVRLSKDEFVSLTTEACLSNELTL